MANHVSCFKGVVMLTASLKISFALKIFFVFKICLINISCLAFHERFEKIVCHPCCVFSLESRPLYKIMANLGFCDICFMADWET